jgi:poly-gamma-glutamate capsule biosynthesis protein CapA/YwtB (metallophosphatase superfamily)
MPLSRRALLAMSSVAPLLPRIAFAAPEKTFRIAFLGQALIQHDLRTQSWGGFDIFAAMFAHSDACFTDLETTIIGPNGGAVTRDPALLHRADASVLDCLSALHVNLFATANNHAFDVGAGGVTDTMAALATRKLAYAGTGVNLAAAAAPGYLRTAKGRVALVAMATGKIRDGGAATPSRPGVNEVRQDSPGVMNEEDVTRLLAAIGQAARQAEIVIAYNHNHYWEPNIADTPGWQKALARRCIDAGATVFVSHGAPILQGIEIYRGRPIFYDLGNFLYQSPSADDPYGAETWRSVIADCTLTREGLKNATLTPVALNPVGVGGASDLETKGRPRIATGAEANSTLDHLATMSAPFGTRIESRDGVGHIN